MFAHRKKRALAAIIAVVALGLFCLEIGRRSADELGASKLSTSPAYRSQVAEKAKGLASDVSDRVAPVVSWKLRMLRLIGFL